MFPRCISERYCDSIRTDTSGNRSGNAPATRRGALTSSSSSSSCLLFSGRQNALSFLLSPCRVCRALRRKTATEATGCGRSNVVDKERSRSLKLESTTFANGVFDTLNNIALKSTGLNSSVSRGTITSPAASGTW